jgi:CheY-like chemotaxis protein
VGENPDEDLAAAVHETTNALTVILGWIERAKVAAGDRPEAQAALERAERYARQARDGMRAAIGAAVERPAPEPAGTLARQIADDLEVEARRADVVIAIDVAPEAEHLELVHPRSAWQVLTNLLLNALAMSPAKSVVDLTVEPDDAGVRFEVRDRGPGVAPSRRDSLFFGGPSERPGGAGIGLRHSRALAEAAGGCLELLDSDVGARFGLSWRRARPTAGATSSRRTGAAPPPSLDGARVLLLEDDDAVVELLELALGARGATVTTVRDAIALDRRLSEAAFDLLLVDLSPLTRQRGGVVTEDQGLAEALTKARSHNPGIGVIVISGSVTVQPRDDILWVRKPFEPRELVDAIARHRNRS